MKRKILSLALALMMIISVAAALPVSAEATSFVVDAFDFTSADAHGYQEGTTESPSVPVSYDGCEDWADENGLYGYTGQIVHYTINVPADGYYRVYAAASTASECAIRLTVADKSVSGTLAVTGEKVAKSNDIGFMYLTAGEQTLTLDSINVIGAIVWDLKFDPYTPTSEELADLLAFVIEGKDFVSGSSTYDNTGLTISQKTNCDWADDDSAQMYNANAVATYSVTIPEAGYYKIIIAIGSNTAENSIAATIEGQTISKSFTGGPANRNHAVGYELDGFVNLTAGTKDLTLKENAATLEVWDIRFVPYTPTSEEMETLKTFVIEGRDFNDKGADEFGGNNHGSYPNTFGPSSKSNCDWADDGTAQISGASAYAEYTVSIPADGYYKIYAAIGSNAADNSIAATIEGQKVFKSFSGPADRMQAVGYELGFVNLTAGTKTLRMDSVTASLELYDIKFAPYTPTSEEILESKKVIVEAGEPANVASQGDGNVFTDGAAPTSKDACDWADAGSIIVFDVSKAVEYSAYIPDTGCYNVYVAAGTSSGDKVTVAIGDTTIVDAALAQTATSTDAKGNYVGKVSLTKGAATLTLSGFAGESASGQYSGTYIYDILLFPVEQAATNDVISILKNDGTAIDNTVAANDYVRAEVSVAKAAAESYNLVIVHYTDNTATKKMISSSITPVTLAGEAGDINVLSATLKLKQAGGYIKAFLWSNDGKYIPVLEGAAADLQ